MDDIKERVLTSNNFVTYDDSASTKVTVPSGVEFIDASSRTKAIRITANKVANSILGGSGKDTVSAGNGDDTIYGGAGNDSLNGGGADKLYGGAGNDTLLGGLGNDTLTGGTGNDIFICSAGKDVIVDYESGDKISLDAAISKATLKGSDAVLTVDKGTLTVKDAKELTLIDSTGKELTTVIGSITYDDSASTKVTVPSGIVIVDAFARTTALKITANKMDNSIVGGSGNDTISAGAGNDTIYGGVGNDSLSGGNGADKLYGGAGNDTLLGGKGNDTFIYSNGDGDNIIIDYQEGHDTIKLNSGFILDTSYDNNDVILMVGGGTITVKDGKGKSVAVTDAFGNTSEKIYTPADSSTEPTAEEILSTIHNVSRNGMKAFVTAFSEVDFQEMLDSVNETYEKDIIKYLQKVYDLSEELLESKIVKGSVASEDKLTAQSDYAEFYNVNDTDDSNEKVLSAEDIMRMFNELSTLKLINEETLAVENFINNFDDAVSHKELVSDAFKCVLKTSNLGSVFLVSYIATDGNVLEDVDFVDGLIDIYGSLLGEVFEATNVTDIVIPIVTGLYNAAVDFNELNDTDNPTFTSGWEKFAHGLSTFVVDGLAEEIPIIGTIFAFFPPDVKEAVRDEIADAFITHSTVILDDTHGSTFRASPTVENIDAQRRKNKIQIICQSNNTSVIGGSGDDTIRGDLGSDTLRGGKGKDSIVGGAGNDMLYGEGSSDVLIGDYYGNNHYIKDKEYGNNSGIDSRVYYKPSDFFGDDTLYGGTGNDTFIGGGGNDVIYCKDGKNLILYANGDGDDIVKGYKSTDTLHVTSGDYKMSRKGNDAVFTVGDGSITLKDFKGKKITVIDKDGNIKIHVKGVVLYGTENSDELIGGDDDDTLYGYGGGDILYGEKGDDVLYGGDGNDDLFGDYDPWFYSSSDKNEGDDVLYGGNGKDNLCGQKGDDTLYGGAGDDSLDGGTGSNLFVGGSGQDTFRFSPDYNNNTTNIIRDYSEDDGDIIKCEKYLTNVEAYWLSEDSKDVVFEWEYYGSKGKVIVKNVRGQFVNFCGTSYNCDASTFYVDDTYPSNTVYLPNKRNALDATACTKSMVLIGNSLNNTIRGGSGNDTLEGSGSFTQNVLWGGAGSDTFVCDYALKGAHDIVMDYTAGDIIKIGDYMWVNTRGYSHVDGNDMYLSFGIQGMPSGGVLVKNAADKNIVVANGEGTFVYNSSTI